MMNKNKRLWAAGKNIKLNDAVHNYIFSKNLPADKKLLKYDIFASKAHAKMLNKIGIISNDEITKIENSLNHLSDLVLENKFSLEGYEDMHSAIEDYLVKNIGESGKKIHTARSRNDQVLTAIRLYTLDELRNVKKLSKNFAKSLHKFAKEYEFIPMPGFTHMQHAMPSSVGQWAGSFLESTSDDIKILNSAIDLCNQNPLGSAASFGTAIEIDREMTTKIMNFEKCTINSLYCQNSKGKIEIFTLSALMQIMMTLEKIANDLVIFCSQEFKFFNLSEDLTTGSSIMPQKRNLDAMEVLRAKSAKIFANITQLTISSHNLLSGYNKDLKFVKDIMIESIEITKDSIEIAKLTINGLFPNQERLLECFKLDPSIFAADLANEMVIKDGIAFRDAYAEVANNLDKLKDIDPIENIKSKKHIGATGNLMLDEIISITLNC